MKSQQLKSRFTLIILLVDERIRIHTDYYISGSWRPKTYQRIRIQNTYDLMVNLPDMLSRDVGLRLCLAMVELIWMDVSSL
jgi:hypothetical protein